MSGVLMIVPPERFRDEELFVTREALHEAGISTTVASTRAGTCRGSRGGTVEAAALGHVNRGDYQGVVVVGGGGARLLFDDPAVQDLVREAAAGGQVLGAICLAPVVLARAGVLNGRRATVAGTMAVELQAHGAHYTGPGVTVDDLLVTANGPKSSRLFGQRIAELINSRASARHRPRA